jgi:hypothetical protein
MKKLCLIVLGVSFAASLMGCGVDDVTWSPRPLVAGLNHVQTCEELLDTLREDARLKVEDEAARMKMSYEGSTGWFRGGWSGGEPTFDAGVGAPEADGPSHYTDTNTQIAGVDEPDFVKTDGLRIFVIHGRSVEVFKSWPAEEMAHVGEIEVEGDPVSMFLAGDKLVVYSQIYFADDSKSGQGSVRPSMLDASDAAWGIAYPYSFRPFTKVSVLDVSGDQPVLGHERYVEGYFRDARRHGDFVRTLIQAPTWEPQWSGADYPSAWFEGRLYKKSAYYEQVDAWLASRVAEIESRDLSGFLPDEYVVVDGELVVVEPRCDRYLAPEPGQSTYGMTVTLTTDLADMSTDDSLFVLGNPSVIFASHDVLVLAQYDWSWFGMGWRGAQNTVVHAFDLDAQATSYAGSAIVQGFVGNQFTLDEKDGVVRIAVTETVFDDENSWGTTWSRVVTLRAEGGELVELGRTPDLAENERIFSARYVGDLAYVVTFRQIDPLFVIDLSDPTQPTVLGELKIPGFSTYMHPLSTTHLLTIGRYVNPDTSFDEGLQLQIFDVSDPTSPQQVQSHVIAGYSAAEYDHKAFVFDPVSEILAVPVDDYGAQFVSSLRLFHVSIAEGFTDAGAIDHSPLFESCVYEDFGYYYYGCGYSSSMRRGLFIDSYVYAISYGGLSVHALGAVETPLVIEPLPEPGFYSYPYFGWEGDVVF